MIAESETLSGMMMMMMMLNDDVDNEDDSDDNVFQTYQRINWNNYKMIA